MNIYMWHQTFVTRAQKLKTQRVSLNYLLSISIITFWIMSSKFNVATFVLNNLWFPVLRFILYLMTVGWEVRCCMEVSFRSRFLCNKISKTLIIDICTKTKRLSKITTNITLTNTFLQNRIHKTEFIVSNKYWIISKSFITIYSNGDTVVIFSFIRK